MLLNAIAVGVPVQGGIVAALPYVDDFVAGVAVALIVAHIGQNDEPPARAGTE